MDKIRIYKDKNALKNSSHITKDRISRISDKKDKSFQKIQQINSNKDTPKDESEEGDDDSSDDEDDDSDSNKPKFYILNGIKYSPTKNCPNNCNKHGICLNNSCLCDQGYTTEDCSITIKDFKKQGFKLNDFLILFFIFILIGMIIQLINFRQENSKKFYDDLLNIE